MRFARSAKMGIAVTAIITGNFAWSAPLSYGTYYDETTSLACGFGQFCRLEFGQTPSDKLVMVRKLQCVINSSSPLSTVHLYIATSPGGSFLVRYLPLQFSPLQPGTTAQSDGFYRYAVDTSTQWLVGQSRYPVVFASLALGSSGTMSSECTIVGDLVTPTP
jgi:hypothetical protein